MANHFRKALNDPEVQELYKDKPFYMAVLHSLAVFKEKGYKLTDLPWFKFANIEKKDLHIKKAA